MTVSKLPPEHYLKLWEAATEQEFGLGINVVPEDQQKLVNALYECRSVCGGFEEFSIFQPQPPGQVWIAKRLQEGVE